MTYPGIREQVDYWVHCVEASSQLNGDDSTSLAYAEVLDAQTARMFDNEPLVLLLAELADVARKEAK